MVFNIIPHKFGTLREPFPASPISYFKLLNMKFASIIITSLVAGTAAFQPTPKQNLLTKNSGSSVQPVVPPVTRNDMVAIRSPFWDAFSSSTTKDISASDYVVDRDYTVALTLILVGIWLTMFGPSKKSIFCYYLWALLICAKHGYVTRDTPDAGDTSIDTLGGMFHLLFGAFIGMQTMRTRAVFTKDSFELKSTANKYLGVAPDKGLIPKQRKNYVLGTENKWRYDSFVNWDFFPSIHLPILVYFKETQVIKGIDLLLHRPLIHRFLTLSLFFGAFQTPRVRVI